MRYFSHNKDEISLKNGEDIIKVKWSNVLNFSTTALIKIKRNQNIVYVFAAIGIIFLFLFASSDDNVAGKFFGFVIYVGGAMSAALTWWYLGVKPYKKAFDNDEHTITLNLRDNVNQTINCGNLSETKRIFEEMKSSYQMSKLKA